MAISRWHSYYSVETDPAEAHVFDPNGSYYGQTKDGSPVWLERYYDWDKEAMQKNNSLQQYNFPRKKEHWWQASYFSIYFGRGNDSLIIKKRGYQDTKHNFVVNFYEGNDGLIYAKNNPQRVMVVLGLPSIE